MKAKFTFLFACGSFAGSLLAQLPASTSPQNKKFIIEEFTGIHCTFCPDGHRIADSILAADPNNVVVVNIHPPNLFGLPTDPGDLDLRVQDGIIIHNAFGVNGYPEALLNRSLVGTFLLASRYAYPSSSTIVKSQAAYCNVALQGTVNVATRVLTVQAQVYYTGTSPKPTNYLSVMLLENKIPAKQSSGSYYYPANVNADGTYNHDHALRKVLTNPFGDAITTTTAGSTYNTTLTYTVPQKYGATPYDYTCLLGRLEIVAFVTQETQTATINAARGPLTLTGFANSLDIGTGQVKNDAQVCAAKLNSTFKFVNYGSSTVTNAVFTYSANGLAASNYTWTGSVGPQNQSQTINLPVFNFTPSASNNIDISVLSVNGSNDQNPANDLTTVLIPQTNIVANNYTMQMIFVQDQYGGECKWTVYDEVSNAVVATDGPFPNLTSAGTATNVKNFVVNPQTCYKLVVTDNQGNGINSVYGVGSYSLLSGSSSIYNSNGKYYDGETVWFKTPIILGMSGAALNISNASVYPNPANNVANINAELNQNENVNIVAINNLGQIIFNENVLMNAGENNFKLNTVNWNAGLYSIKLITPNGTITNKLIIAK